MQILTDILSLFKRKQMVKETTPDDLIVIGRHEEPDMLGIASPIPYKSAKLIKVKDLLNVSECNYSNLNNATGTNPNGIYINKTSDPCSVNLRSITAVGNNINIVTNSNEIEVSTTGEPNIGYSVGTGKSIYKDKLGEILRFKTITNGNGAIGITESADEIDINLKKVLLSSPDGTVWEITVDNGGKITATAQP